MSKKSAVYYIPYKFRRIENLHILLWLIKDACWALNLTIPAIAMILPTLMVAVMITYQTRKITSEFLHNLSIIFWIVANCTWMVGEFFGWDANLVGPYGLREFALVPFGIGLLILAYYYLFLVNRKDFEEQVLQQTERVIQEQEARSIN